MWLPRWLQWILRHMYRDSDTAEDCRIKDMWMLLGFSIYPFVVINSVDYLGGGVSKEKKQLAVQVASIIYITGFTFGIAWPFILRTLPQWFVGSIMGFLCTGMILSDWDSGARMQPVRPWGLVVLAMDILLAFNVPREYQQYILGMTTAWVVISSMETGYRLGLYDIEDFADSAEISHACRCANPPCAEGITAVTYFTPLQLFILLGDFFATRGFSEGLRAEQAKIVASVRVAERLAELLAMYATEAARRVVAEEGATLPEQLRASFEQLLANLDSYRAFLPDALLFAAQQQQREGEDHRVVSSPLGADGEIGWQPQRAAPGLGEELPSLAVCFTDIQSSTELWETFPQGMYEALNVHNSLMRRTYAACAGYEVKTIGDSFMVAFDGGQDAVRFGLEAQLGLLRQRWPEDLLTHPLCQRLSGEAGEPLWGGLRVRIGVQSGPARVETNPVTGRSDYFGPTVNTAARLEAVLRHGGLVATSDAVVGALTKECLQELGSPVVHDAGVRELKGVKDKITVWALMPRQLAQRVAVLSAGYTTSAWAALDPDDSSSSRLGRDSTHSQLDGRSAVWSAQQDPLRAGRPPPSISLQLQRAEATCAVARIDLRSAEPVAERYPVFTAAAALAADRTRGVVDSVLSACVVATWNASRPCTDHTAACRTFFRAAFRAPVHLGAASGGALHGNVAAGRRSFTVVVGGCVELAAALAWEAARIGDAVLATGAVAADCAAAGTAHCAQLWQARGSPPVVVYAVDVRDGDDEWMLQDDERDALHWSDSLAALLCKACAAGPGPGQDAVLAELQQLAAGEGSPTGRRQQAARLAERIAAGAARGRPMLPLWEPQEGR